MTNQEAISRIKDHISVHKIGEYPHIHIAEALNMAISALESQSGWIPCSERLPTKDDGLLIVTVYDRDALQTEHRRVPPCLVAYDEDKKRFYIFGEYLDPDGTVHGVIAWKKALPEPYNPDHIRDTTKKVKEA